MLSIKEFLLKQADYLATKEEFDKVARDIAVRIMDKKVVNVGPNYDWSDTSYTENSAIVGYTESGEYHEAVSFPIGLLEATSAEIDQYIDVALAQKIQKEKEIAEYWKKKSLADKEAQYEKLKRELNK